MSERPILWTPSQDRIESCRMAQFIRFLSAEKGRDFTDYNALWRWSTEDLDGFWQAIWEFFDFRSSAPHSAVLAKWAMPGAEWFPGVQLNYAEQILRHAETKPDATALIIQSETFGASQLRWSELRAQVGAFAAQLRKLGVSRGDRVVAILPNTEHALIAALASFSLGAIWSLCAPDMGHVAILDRFQQIEPKVLIAQDGYVHAGKQMDRREVVKTIREGLPSLVATVGVPVIADLPEGVIHWDDMTRHSAEIDFEQVPFDHPLWIVYSSGTTGNPKPIVHGHGGVLVEGAKQSLHKDIGPDDRFAWLTSSGWIMWNTQLSGMAQGATLGLFDGAPNHPDMMAVWRFVADQKLTNFGAGAAFFATCLKAGIRPGDELDLSALQSLGSTGSPLSEDAYDWIYSAVKADLWLAPLSGGTDLAGSFVGGNPMLPVRAGEMQVRYLGNAVRSFDAEGKDLTGVPGAVGELVCTQPLPSFPLFFWGDEDGSRLFESYFDTYKDVWRHGDWIEITAEGGAVIYGRSDATINRKGLRLGSSEIYSAVEGLDFVLDSLVVDLEYLGRESFMPLFVALKPGLELTEDLAKQINDAIRQSVSARFVPNEVVHVAEIPRTLSGKKLEVPVKKLLLGGDPAKIVNRDSMANPESFDFFVSYAAKREAT